MKVLVKTKLLVDGDRKYVEIRDYELGQKVKVIYCEALDYKACNHIDCKFMYLTPSQQKQGKVVNTQQSKFPPYSYYKLKKFLWKPERVVKEVPVEINLSVRERLSERFKNL